MQIIYTAECNGFVGIGHTPHEAQIALDYAACFLPLGEASKDEKTAVFGNLPGWDGKEEACWRALVGKSV